MSKPSSYYDWELRFKTKKKTPSIKKNIRTKNTIDIEPDLFSNYLRYWKKKYLPVHD